MLRDTGETVDADDAPAPPPQSGVILLSRALCRFAFTPRATSLSAKEEEDAALLHAEAHAPFATSHWIVVRSPAGFGVWWWDASQVSALVEGKTPYAPDRFIPESLGHGGAQGWRQVRSIDGYEAQYYEGGVLRASSWRRGPFDAREWRGFVSAAPAPCEPGPTNLRRLTRQGGPSGNPGPATWWCAAPCGRRVERTAWMTAAASVAVSMVLLGHAARHQSVADAYRGAIGAIKSDSAALRVESRTARDMDLAVAAASVAPLPDHLVAVADVMTAMAGAGVEPSSWQSNSETVSVAGAGAPSIEEIASRLEQSPRLRNVEPFRVGEETVIRADVEFFRGAISDGAP